MAVVSLEKLLSNLPAETREHLEKGGFIDHNKKDELLDDYDQDWFKILAEEAKAFPHCEEVQPIEEKPDVNEEKEFTKKLTKKINWREEAKDFAKCQAVVAAYIAGHEFIGHGLTNLGTGYGWPKFIPHWWGVEADVGTAVYHDPVAFSLVALGPHLIFAPIGVYLMARGLKHRDEKQFIPGIVFAAGTFQEMLPFDIFMRTDVSDFVAVTTYDLTGHMMSNLEAYAGKLALLFPLYYAAKEFVWWYTLHDSESPIIDTLKDWGNSLAHKLSSAEKSLKTGSDNKG